MVSTNFATAIFKEKKYEYKHGYSLFCDSSDSHFLYFKICIQSYKNSHAGRTVGGGSSLFYEKIYRNVKSKGDKKKK